MTVSNNKQARYKSFLRMKILVGSAGINMRYETGNICPGSTAKEAAITQLKNTHVLPMKEMCLFD